jgi:hypothetical protein
MSFLVQTPYWCHFYRPSFFCVCLVTQAVYLYITKEHNNNFVTNKYKHGSVTLMFIIASKEQFLKRFEVPSAKMIVIWDVSLFSMVDSH